eukprot:110130-Pelagomonas_calceolata.AAC.1
MLGVNMGAAKTRERTEWWMNVTFITAAHQICGSSVTGLNLRVKSSICKICLSKGRAAFSCMPVELRRSCYTFAALIVAHTELKPESTP